MRKIWIILNIPRLLIALFVFLANRNNMIDDLESFLNYGTKRKLGNEVISMFSLLLFNKEYRNVFVYRQPLVLKKILSLVFPITSLYIVTKSENLGNGLLVVHGFATIINAKRVGENFTIYQQCTVGYGKTGKPTIGNNVTMYAGAIVIGDITIGDNCIIGAGTVINKSLPPNTTCVGKGFRVL